MKDPLNTLLHNEFPVEDHYLYMNHAAVAPLPLRSANALKRFLDRYVNEGAAHYPQWIEVENELRGRLANMINSDIDDIALTKNTSEALSFVAHGFPWYEGDNVVISDEEFPSNRYVWQSLAPYGVTVRQVNLKGELSPEEALLAACDNKTRMISISTVQYASGLRMNLEKLGAACKQADIALCVDAIQGLGVVPHDVKEMHIDFLMADGHKWLLGPEGLAVFYCSSRWRELMKLHEFGWHMVEHPHDFFQKEWQPAHTAKRFECGSPNILGAVALNASLSLFEEIGLPEIERRVLANTEKLFDLIQKSDNLELLTNTAPGRYAGITVFRHRHEDTDTLLRHLTDNKVVCIQRGGGIRLSPHFYTRPETLEQAVNIARQARE